VLRTSLLVGALLTAFLTAACGDGAAPKRIRQASSAQLEAAGLHQDGEREAKTFAPGYGEFFTGGGGAVEALALAVPHERPRAPFPRRS
jgi:hypothetical protein